MLHKNLNESSDLLLHFYSKEQAEYLAAFDKKESGKLIAKLANGSALHMIGVNFNMHEALVDVLKMTGPAAVDILTYSMTDYPMRIISSLAENKTITDLRLILDFTVSRTPALDQFVKSFCPDIKYTSSHAKILLVKNDAWSITLLGSANFTRNNRFENYIVFSDIDTFNSYLKIYNTIYEHSNA